MKFDFQSRLLSHFQSKAHQKLELLAVSEAPETRFDTLKWLLKIFDFFGKIGHFFLRVHPGILGKNFEKIFSLQKRSKITYLCNFGPQNSI